MNKEDLWNRFDKETNTANDEAEGSLCHRCKHATKTEVIEPRVDPERFKGLHESWYAPVDRSTFRPTMDAPACMMCFEGWVEEKRDEGKICIRCGEWVKPKDVALYIEERVGEGKLKGRIVSKHALCIQCLTGGKSIDEWAKDMIEKKKGEQIK